VGFFFFLSSLKFAFNEIRTQDLLRARHYRAGLATRPPNLSLATAYVAGDELLSMVHEARGVSPAVVVASSTVATSKASWG